jgi:hypothetical protein
LSFALAGFYADDVVAVDLEVAAHLQDFADAGAREAAFIHNSTVSFIVIIYTFLGILIVLKFEQRESNTEQANKYQQQQHNLPQNHPPAIELVIDNSDPTITLIINNAIAIAPPPLPLGILNNIILIRIIPNNQHRMIKPIHIDRLLIPRTRIHPIRILPEPRTRMHARNTRALLDHSSEVVVAAAKGPVCLHLVQPLHGGGLAGVGDVYAVTCDVVLLVGEGGLQGDSVLHDEHCGFSEVSEAWILGAVALAATLDHVLFGKIVLYAAHLHQVRLVHGCHGERPARRTNSHVLHPGDGVLISPIPIGRQVTAYPHLVRVICSDVLAVDECYKNHEQNHQFYT